MCKTTGKTTVAPTKKGARIWLQGLESLGWQGGTRYNVKFCRGFVTLTRCADGKRKVTPSKGGVIDLESKQIQKTFDGHTSAMYDVSKDEILIIGE